MTSVSNPISLKMKTPDIKKIFPIVGFSKKLSFLHSSPFTSKEVAGMV